MLTCWEMMTIFQLVNIIFMFTQNKSTYALLYDFELFYIHLTDFFGFILWNISTGSTQ